MTRRAMPARNSLDRTAFTSGLLKPHHAETTRQMKIQLIHGRPRGPMRMRIRFGAFVEIRPPNLAPEFSDCADILFQKPQWNEKLQRPGKRRGGLGLDLRKQGRSNLHPCGVGRRTRRELLEAVRRALRIEDVRTE